MKTIPILFQPEMVDAILNGTKTQTRRICKHQHWSHSELTDVNINGITTRKVSNVNCPYGQPGDVLYVRENYKITATTDGFIHFFFRNGEKSQELAFYKKDFSLITLRKISKRKLLADRVYSCPGIHLYKEAARIWLQVEEVKVERLNEITDDGAKAEGIIGHRFEIGLDGPYGFEYKVYTMSSEWTSEPRDSFKSLWNHINGVDAWNANPWVWVVKFKVLSTTGRPDIEALEKAQAHDKMQTAVAAVMQYGETESGNSKHSNE